MEILTIDEAAVWLRCSKRTVYRRKEIPRIRDGGRFLFIKEDLEAYINSRREACGDPPKVQIERIDARGQVDAKAKTPYHRNPLFRLPSPRSA